MNDIIKLRDKLRELGYAASIANDSCFDIRQDGRIHYLSRDEAEMLAQAGAGINLMDHGERRGLNYWYDFARAEQGEEGEK